MKTKAWLKAFRLRTLPLAFSVIVAGTALSLHFGEMQSSVILDNVYQAYNELPVPNQFGDSISEATDLQSLKLNIPVFILTLLTTLFLQILSNLANDYGDYKKGTDDAGRIGPTRALQSGAITQKQMFTAIVIFTLLCLASGISLLYLAFGAQQMKTIMIFLGIGILCIAAAIKYTMGKGAYGYKALGDIAVFVFFGGVGVLGSFYLQTRYLNIYPLLIAIAYGFWCTAVLNLNNMRDVDNDVLHKKFTMAYYLGFKGAKAYQLILVLAPYAFVYWVAQMYLGPVKALLALVPLPLSLVQVIKIMKVTERRSFDKFLKFQALITFLNSLVLFCCLSLMHG